MKTTKFIAICILTLCNAIVALANDGEYHVSGNQLIPISDTDIKVKKEVLTLQLTDGTRDENDFTYVDVEYIFFNSSPTPKTVKMGFEADIEDDEALVPDKKHKGHPYIYDFKVEMNGQNINYTNEYAFCIKDTAGHIIGHDYKNFPVDKTKWVLGGKKYEEINDYWDEGLMHKDSLYCKPYAHVYYFEVTFQPGENKIHHTYKYDSGRGQNDAFTIKYWLKPAMRWSGSKIDDFTLRISAKNTAKHFMLSGPFSNGTFNVASGAGKYRDTENGKEIAIRNGVIEYHCTDFIPNDNLLIKAMNQLIYKYGTTYKDKIGEFYDRGFTFHCDIASFLDYKAIPAWQKRLLRNLPYANRGYVFKDEKLQNYFSQFFWYIPDPDYKPSTADFTKSEIEAQKWLTK